MDPLTLSKDALRENGTPWLIKCPGEENLSNVGHFNIDHMFHSQLSPSHFYT
jgi:hypothetical protein